MPKRKLFNELTDAIDAMKIAPANSKLRSHKINAARAFSKTATKKAGSNRISPPRQEPAL